MSSLDDIKQKAKSVTETELAKKIQDSANNILQAGLGALAKQQESGKVFEALVKRGQELESKAGAVVKQRLSAAEDRVDEVRQAAQRTVSAVKDKAYVSLDKLETSVQAGVSQALESINVLTNDKMTKLATRIEELEHTLEKLEAKLKKNSSQ